MPVEAVHHPDPCLRAVAAVRVNLAAPHDQNKLGAQGRCTPNDRSNIATFVFACFHRHNEAMPVRRSSIRAHERSRRLHYVEPSQSSCRHSFSCTTIPHSLQRSSSTAPRESALVRRENFYFSKPRRQPAEQRQPADVEVCVVSRLRRLLRASWLSTTVARRLSLLSPGLSLHRFELECGAPSNAGQLGHLAVCLLVFL